MKISIITINYNDKIGLEKTYKSVVNQSCKDFEFVIIDGGSNDGCVQFLENNSQNIHYWISEKDKGVYNAMNKGIKAAEGDYVIFMNSGDAFNNNFVLATMLPTLNENYGFVYGNSVYYRDNIFERNQTPPKILTFNHFFSDGLNHQAVFIKRQLFYDSFFYNENYKICSDWEFFIINICLKSVSYKYVETSVVDYDLGGMSAKAENLIIYKQEREITLRKYFPAFYDGASFINDMKIKRVQQFYKIRNNKTAWKIMRGILNIFMLFFKKD